MDPCLNLSETFYRNKKMAVPTVHRQHFKTQQISQTSLLYNCSGY